MNATTLYSLIAALLVLASFENANAFAPSVTSKGSMSAQHHRLDTRRFINVGEKERDALTRESEPEEFFATYVLGIDKLHETHSFSLCFLGTRTR